MIGWHRDRLSNLVKIQDLGATSYINRQSAFETQRCNLGWGREHKLRRRLALICFSWSWACINGKVYSAQRHRRKLKCILSLNHSARVSVLQSPYLKLLYPVWKILLRGYWAITTRFDDAPLRREFLLRNYFKWLLMFNQWSCGKHLRGETPKWLKVRLNDKCLYSPICSWTLMATLWIHCLLSILLLR